MTKVEQVARAIFADKQSQHAWPVAWEAATEQARSFAMGNAKAAITAMLEPSDKMLAAGVARLDYDSEGGLIGGATEAVENVFEDMLKVALRST